jgi:hypothetical protein
MVMQSFTQKTFLGASITNFQASIGWNDSASTLSVGLVEDSTNGDDFDPPLAGQPAIFEYQDWVFGGIVDRYVKKQGESGNPLYNIQLKDPRELLDGVVLILNDYNGATSAVYNLYNVYGYYENVSFGSSLVNDTGFLWYKIRTAMQNLLVSNLIKYAGYGYTVDFTNISPAALGLGDYRIPGDHISLLEYIQQVCDAAGHDFFVTLQAGGVITINTVNRKNAPTLGYIERFINSLDGVVYKENGIEARNEVVSKFVTGGNVCQIHITNSDDNVDEDEEDEVWWDNNIWPFWGYDIQKKVIIGENDFETDDHNFTLDSRALALEIPGFPVTYTSDVGEMRAAIGGQDSWEAYIVNNKDTERHGWKYNFLIIGDGVNSRIINALKTQDSNIINTWGPNQFSPIDTNAFALSITQKNKKDNEFNRVTRTFNFVSHMAEEYYGRKFMVRSDYLYYYNETDTGRVVFNYEPADGGYVEESEWSNAAAAGLLPYDISDLLTDDSRIQSYVKISGYGEPIYDIEGNITDVKSFIDLSGFSPDDYILEHFEGKDEGEVRSNLFLKCEVEPTPVYLNSLTNFSPRFIITLPGPLRRNDDIDLDLMFDIIINALADRSENFDDTDFFLDPLTGEARRELYARNVLTTFGSDTLWYPKSPKMLRPDMVGIALKHNTELYGPWYSLKYEGRVQYEKDESLVPWNYGGYTYMNVAGLAKASYAYTGQQLGESGSVEFPGAPQIQLGGVLITGGPNVTDVNVSIGEEGATTTYKMQTWSFRPGKAKQYNLDRYKQITNLAVQQRRAFRQIFKPAAPMMIFKEAIKAIRAKQKQGRQKKPKSSHALICSEILGQDDSFRTSSVITTDYQLVTQVGNEYDNKASASLDSVFRPFATYSHGTMPSFVEPGTTDLPTVDDLNPFGENHDVSILTSNSSENEPICIFNSGETNYKAVALKGPLVVAGFGYDTDGYPVPNSGTQTDAFLENHRSRYDQWKVGPVDIRWDENRGVWTGEHIKNFCRFTLNEELTIEDENVGATIETQYGRGAFHAESGITVHNLLTSTGDYEFYGDSGDYGLAVWNSGTDWIIYMLECA